MDNKFKPLQKYIETRLLTNLEVCAGNDHVFDVKRMIWIVKEQVQSAYNFLPFKHVLFVLFDKLVRLGPYTL